MYSEISLIFIQCDMRYGYLAYVNDCHMTENWMLQTCVFIQGIWYVETICYVMIKTTFTVIS